MRVDTKPWKCPSCKATINGLWEVGSNRVCCRCGFSTETGLMTVKVRIKVRRRKKR